jgi:hypothetical protein
LVGIFGVMHHIPCFGRRESLLQTAASRLRPGGILALAFWRFGTQERFSKRELSWEVYNRDAEFPIDTAQLEPGDSLLRWGEEDGPARYCHFVDDREYQLLLDSMRLDVVDQYLADGRSGDLNQYAILRRTHG